MKKHSITAFYLETLLLVVVFVCIILVLTRVFGMGKSRTEDARLLTNAVSLSVNAAEAVHASKSLEDVLTLLDENGNAELGEDGVLYAYYDADMAPDRQGSLYLTLTWEPEQRSTGTLAASHIRVGVAYSEDALYSMETAVFIPIK